MVKKHIVHLSYSTYVDVEVIAHDSVSCEDVVNMARKKVACNNENINKEIIENLRDSFGTHIADTQDLFDTKNQAYDALCERVERAGGYLCIKKEWRPTITIDEYDEGKMKKVTVKSLFLMHDDSSPLQIIDENDERWDVDDYLFKEDIEELWLLLNEDY